MNNNQTPDSPKTKKRQKIMAWAGILVLILLYLATFLTAVLDTPWASRLFPGFLVTSITLPLLLWVYLWIYRKVKEAGK